MDLFQKKYLKYKTKYELIKNQTGGNYLLTLTEDDKCPICSEKLIDTCSTCNENGKNFCPHPQNHSGTNTQYCNIFIGNCGHLMHRHCFSKIPYIEHTHKQLCPLCREVFNPIITTSPQYVWSSGFIAPLDLQVQIKKNESGGKWKQIKLINLIELIQTRQPIAPYIYNDISRSYNFSSPEAYDGIVKTYEDSIKQ